MLLQQSATMECQYVATQRGGVALLFEGHRYNKVRDGKDGTVYWRCSRDRQCPGRAVTVNNRVKKANNKHNHPPEGAIRNGNANTSLLSSSNAVSASTSKDRKDDSLMIPSSLVLQDVIEAQAAAAAAAASFPAIVTETLNYLAAASGHSQMAAFASMASLINPSFKNFESLAFRNSSYPVGGLLLFDFYSFKYSFIILFGYKLTWLVYFYLNILMVINDNK